jgi:hypothetical protein
MLPLSDGAVVELLSSFDYLAIKWRKGAKIFLRVETELWRLRLLFNHTLMDNWTLRS